MSNSKVIKLLNVASFAAIGHLLSIIIIPYTSKILGASAAADVAKIDSTILLITSILAFGLSLTVARDVAKGDSWVEVVNQCISARLSLAIILQAISLFAFLFEFIDVIVFLCFLIAPVVAVNIDFVLYGRDMPVKAAYNSFMRVSMPIVMFILLIEVFGVTPSYFFLVLIFYSLSVIFIFVFLRFVPRGLNLGLSALKSYKNVIPLGLSTVFISFQRFGFLGFLNIDDKSTAVLSSILKVYLAYVAIRRLFIQTFYVHLLKRNIYKNIEWICLVAAFVIFSILIFFAEDIVLWMSPDEIKDGVFYIYFCAVLVLSGSLFSTADARLLLEGKDKILYCSSFLSFLTWVFGMVLCFTLSLDYAYIILCVAFSELVLSLLYKYSLKS